MKKNVFNKRRFKHGSLATIMTIGLIVVVVLVNIVASMLAERFPVNIDLTANKIYELSQDSINYVKKLDQPITVEVLAEEESFVSRGEYYKQANEIFKKYNMYSKNITLKYTDPYTNPDALSKYPKENLNVGDVIVSAGERYRALGGLDLFNVDTEQGVITSSKAENAITNAIMLVTDANPTTVTVLTGYKSGSVSGLTDLLQSNGYLVTETNIMTTAIDPNVQIAILPAPVVDLTAESLKKIDAYLDNDGQYGKNLYYFADVSQPELPRVEEFLSEWGMALGKGMVIETNDQKIMGNQSFVMQNYKDSSIAKGLPLTEEKEDVLMTVQYRPVEPLFTESSNRTTEILMSSDKTGALMPMDAGENWKLSDDVLGSYASLVLGQRKVINGNDEKVSSVAVFGSSYIADPMFLSVSAFNNAQYLLHMSNKLCNKEESGVVITAKESGNQMLGITEAQKKTISLIFQYILPAAVLIAGAVIWIRRRNR